MRQAVLVAYDFTDLYAFHVRHRIEAADMVHHIIEVEEDWSKRLDIDNLIPLSNQSHAIITALYNKDAETKAQTQRLLLRLAADHFGAGGIGKVSGGAL